MKLGLRGSSRRPPPKFQLELGALLTPRLYSQYLLSLPASTELGEFPRGSRLGSVPGEPVPEPIDPLMAYAYMLQGGADSVVAVEQLPQQGSILTPPGVVVERRQ